ncbi:hypothetical protein HELRODRAFT_84464 [Helobdella robusta]|uniref:1-phosphatidylinositol-5-phosphate 4-kinase n=1 Tax=Helobdella robusta TaxID=6412 RepID=T1G5I9_HELRO|nr:hypothetical protein HELRODRAFT_84464 [Helobdella robusta]ESN98521.1 hypothetical protein HELRODRAFT_84464 [Helobdella robusta]
MSTTKQKKKHLKAVRPKLRLFRAKEPLFSVFMWGINHSISELTHVSTPVMLMPDDFKAYTKTRVDNHMFNKENMPSHFKFKEYCPNVFRNLRERFNVDDDTYLKSLTKDCPQDLKTNAKAGSSSRPMQSYDKIFFIKTISSEQVAEMHRILKEYHQYIVERHADTLLPQYLGMYRVSINDSETYLLVSKNIFSRRFTIHKKYDLKGSTVSRQASDKEKSKDLPTLKDNDFLSDRRIIQVGQEKRDKLLTTLKADTEFLANLSLVNYSLVVGIHDRDSDDAEPLVLSSDNDLEDDDDDNNTSSPSGRGDPTPPESPQNVRSYPGYADGELDPFLEPFGIKSCESCPRPEIYFLAIIDILTHYGVKKSIEQTAKTVKYGPGAEISTVAPDVYARRFQEFVERITE